MTIMIVFHFGLQDNNIRPSLCGIKLTHVSNIVVSQATGNSSLTVLESSL